MKIHVLKQGNKSLSLTYNQRHYVIGFQSTAMARKVHYNLHPDPESRMRIERREHVDVTRDVKNGLRELDVLFSAESVTIDTRALLYMPKATNGSILVENDAGIHLSTMDYSDFIMYPFENNIGVIMPYDLLYETPFEFTFTSQVIDPSIDPKSFLKSLKFT
jgi:hypothetical protein